MLWAYVPLAGIVALIVIAGFVRPVIQLRRYGSVGIFFFAGGPAQKRRDALFILMLAGFVAQAITGAKRPLWVRLLVAEGSTAYDVLQVAGAALIIGGIILFAAAQLNLGASWRIGIDRGSAPGMVTGGLDAVSRHPIFLGFLTVFAGYAAMLPTPLSVALLVGACIGFRMQAYAEEAHMLRTYGEAYRDYASRVGRFLPGVGKLCYRIA